MTTLNAIGWTLIHFLWQGAAVAALYALADGAAMRHATARLRYALACGAMLLMLVAAVGTFATLTGASNTVASPASSLAPYAQSSAGPHSTTSAPEQARPAPDYLPWLAYAWMAGVGLLCVRLAVEWQALQHCRRQGARNVEGDWEVRLRRMAERLGVPRAVRLCESVVADVPAVIGWLRPVILMPASALTCLTPEQVEAVLAHELAHVLRNDYLMNLMQTCVETLLFFHPCTWWIGRRVREQRENCCDDLAVAACGNPLVYARALAQLELLRGTMPELAMAATRGSLLDRIERLVAPRPPARAKAAVGIAAAAILTIGFAAWAAPNLLPSSAKVVAALTIGEAQPTAIPTPSPSTAPAAAPTPHPEPGAEATNASQSSEDSSAAASGQDSSEARSPTSFLDELDRAGYRNLTVNQLIALKTQGVDGAFIAEMKSLGWTPTVEQLTAFRIHGVSAAEVKEMRALGYQLTPEQAITMRVHGLAAADVSEWKKQGFSDPDFNQLVALKIHGVSAEFVAEIKALGWSPTMEKLTAFRIHGVSAAQVKEMRTLGYPLTPDQAIAMRIHGITPAFVNDWKRQSVGDLDFDRLVALKIHGANAADLGEFGALGLRDLKADDLIKLRVMGVTPDFVRQAQKRGFKDLKIDQLIQLKQLGILDSKQSI